MAHTRQRQLDGIFEKLIGFSPIVGIFGHRQVGKTTYLSGKVKKYVTLDDEDTLKTLQQGPLEYLRKLGPLPAAIDECQIEPRLFPALKEWVRTHKRPGQFVLSGSVRFTSRRAIRESLAGRLVAIELLPLILSELEETPLPDLLPQLLSAKSFTENTLTEFPSPSEVRPRHQTLKKYLENGGLPGICFVRSARLRRELLIDLHRLILDRDLRLIHSTKLSLETLQRFHRELATLASAEWIPYEGAKIQKKLGLAPATQKALLHAFEATYMIRRIPVEGRSGEIILLEDQFEELELTQSPIPEPFRFLGAFYRNARAQFHYRLGQQVRVFSYLTRSGARVPLCFATQEGKLGFIPLASDQEKPTLAQSRAADSFLRAHPDAKVIYLATVPIKTQIRDARSLICPIASLI